MTQRHLAGARILAQGLVGPVRFRTPLEAARSFGAHQGQDLPGALASLALRTGGDLTRVYAAFDSGLIVRGYPMRGTVFVVAADTLAWLTELCADAPVRAAMQRRSGLGLEEEHFTTARRVLEEVAAEHSDVGMGRGVLRADLMNAWQDAGLATDEGRGYHMLTHFLSTGVAAYGPWRDEGETAVVLAEQWLPHGSGLEGTFGGDETAAIAELALRYFTTHGPASVRDLSWWSKLPMGRIKDALGQVEGQLEHGWADATGALHTEASSAKGGDGEKLYFRPGLIEEYAEHQKEAMAELLLPGFDELVLGYRDRLFLMDEDRHRALVPGNNGVFKRAAIRRGEVVGTWSRTGAAGKRRLALQELATVSPTQKKRFEKLFQAFPYTLA